METVSLIPSQRKQLLKLLREDSQFANNFIAYVLARNVGFEEDLVDQVFNSSQRRLERALVILAQYGKTGQYYESSTQD